MKKFILLVCLMFLHVEVWAIDPVMVLGRVNCTGSFVTVTAITEAITVTEIVEPVTTTTQLVDENGAAYGVKHIDNKPRVSSMPYQYDIAEGNVPGHTAVKRYGHNQSVGTSIETLSNEAVNGLRNYLSSAEQLQIVSSDVNDFHNSTGARTIKITGLDADWALQSETVTLDDGSDGQDDSTTAGSYIRILQAEVLTAGTSGANEGTITIENNASDTALEYIAPGSNRAHSAVFTVPAGKTFYCTNWYGSESSSKGSEVSLWVKFYGFLWQERRAINTLDTIFNVPFSFPLVITEKSDIEMRATGVLAGANITGGFQGWFE